MAEPAERRRRRLRAVGWGVEHGTGCDALEFLAQPVERVRARRSEGGGEIPQVVEQAFVEAAHQGYMRWRKGRGSSSAGAAKALAVSPSPLGGRPKAE